MRIPTQTYNNERHGSTRWKYAHYKLDGHSLNVIRSTSDGKAFAFTSRPKDIFAELPPRFQQLINGFPKGTSLLGELYVLGKTAADVRTAINEHADKLEFSAFAILNCTQYATEAGRREIDRVSLEECNDICKQLGVHFLEWVRNPIINQEFLDKRPKCVEGYVLKNGNMLDWCKLKPKRTIDLLVLGFTAGTGKYTNLIGAIECSTVDGVRVADVSGMTDVQRRYFTEHSDRVIGQVVEVEYQGIGARGRLRHPVFLRVRDDKAGEFCTLSQDDELAETWRQINAAASRQGNLF